ncbi:transcription factor [Pseudoalteromonas sp. SG44-1]|uniref:HTH-like domain-containing protein n=1 Tax=Pseudoalteromonas sp. SG44-1 TaxID=2760964 RepID=UPI00160091DD|nr:transcription factor [Pseudoalteromonas sp. SG44-1]MBB1419624.1 transcription factor [Pseudoalteromonas sp. SG44-1]
MSNKAIFKQIKQAFAEAPRNQYTAELHLQMIKFADELKHITAKEFCEEMGLKPKVSPELAFIYQ